MNIAICTDNPVEQQTLITRIEKYMDEKEIVTHIFTFVNGKHLCAQANSVSKALDLIFLDMDTADQLGGIETAKMVRALDVRAELILVSSSEKYALESYDVDALCYLIKPMEARKFAMAMERYLRDYRPKSVSLGGRLYVQDEIVYAESDLKKVVIHFSNGTHATIREKLGTVEALLSDHNFLRCHQSFIINLNYVMQIKDDMFLTKLGAMVNIRKREIQKFRRLYSEFISHVGGDGRHI